MSSGNQIVEEMDGRLRHLRLVEEFDPQGEILGKAHTFVVRSRME
jgi:hypothetical protein